MAACWKDWHPHIGWHVRICVIAWAFFPYEHVYNWLKSLMDENKKQVHHIIIDLSAAFVPWTQQIRPHPFCVPLFFFSNNYWSLRLEEKQDQHICHQIQPSQKNQVHMSYAKSYCQCLYTIKTIMPKYSNKSVTRVQMFIGLSYLFVYIH